MWPRVTDERLESGDPFDELAHFSRDRLPVIRAGLHQIGLLHQHVDVLLGGVLLRLREGLVLVEVALEAARGDGSQTAFGARAGATVLTRATTVLGALFVLGAIILGVYGQRGPGSVLSGVKGPAAPVQTPAPK